QAIGGNYYAFTVTFPNTPFTDVLVSVRATDQSGNVATSGSQTVHIFQILDNVRSIQIGAPASVGSSETFSLTATLVDSTGTAIVADTRITIRNTLSSEILRVDVNTVSQVTTPYSISGIGFGVIEVQDTFGGGAIGTKVIQVTAGPPTNVTVEFFRTERL